MFPYTTIASTTKALMNLKVSTFHQWRKTNSRQLSNKKYCLKIEISLCFRCDEKYTLDIGIDSNNYK